MVAVGAQLAQHALRQRTASGLLEPLEPLEPLGVVVLELVGMVSQGQPRV